MRLGGLERGTEGVHFGRHLSLERLGIAAHEAARREEGGAGFGGERGRLAYRMRHQLALRHDGVDETKVERPISAEGLGEQQEFRSPGAPEPFRRR